MVARTETAYAFTQGRLESYKQTGIVSYVEFFTAEDELTCPECSTLNGVYYKLEDADGVIPVHPHCKCTFLPVLNGDYSEMKDIAESNLLAVYS